MTEIIKNGLYLVSGIKELITSVGGEFNDFKNRPVVALLQSEHQEIYWAVPIGDVAHRNKEQMDRIQSFLDSPKKEIRSCYYHIGNTNKKSIFFMSDVFPVTLDYITREYNTFNQQHYIIKNKELLTNLEEKLKRILSYEKSKLIQNGKFFFRQNIFGSYNKLVQELEQPKDDDEDIQVLTDEEVEKNKDSDQLCSCGGLRKVENQPIMTVEELKSYYPNNWYRYSVVEGNAWENPNVIELVQVTHLADSEDELLNIPEDEMYLPGSPGGGCSWGRNVNPEPGIQIANIDFGFPNYEKK